MTMEVQLSQPSGPLSAAQGVALTVRVHSAADVVDAYTFEILGPLAPWTKVEPAQVQLMPTTTGEASVVVAAAGAAVGAGSTALAVRVTSTQSGVTKVEEVTIDVAPAGALTARLVPTMSRGKGKATHSVVLSNTGNTPLAVSLSASDPNEELALDLKAASVTLGPGEGTDVGLKLVALARHERPMPFQVTIVGAQPGTSTTLVRTTVEGSHVRRRGHGCLFVLLALFVLLVLAAGVLYQQARTHEHSWTQEAKLKVEQVAAGRVAATIDKQNDRDADVHQPPATGAGSSTGPAAQASTAHVVDLQSQPEAVAALHEAARSTDEAGPTTVRMTLVAAGSTAFEASEDGVLDVKDQRADTTHTDGDQHLHLVVIDHDVYVSGSNRTPNGKTWGSLGRTGGTVADAGAPLAAAVLSGSDVLRALRSVGKVEPLGEGTVEGTKVQRYATVLTAGAVDAAIPEVGGLFSKVKMDVEVQVGPDDRVRRAVVVLRYRSQSLTLVLDLTDVGAASPVDKPPADDTEPISLAEAADVA